MGKEVCVSADALSPDTPEQPVRHCRQRVKDLEDRADWEYVADDGGDFFVFGEQER